MLNFEIGSADPGVVLSMKSMNIDNVTNFPFPTPPDREHMAKAERVSNRSF